MSDEKAPEPADALQQLEDEALNLWHKLESRKLDLFLLGSENPRSIFIRDEAKAILSQYVEVQRRRMQLARGSESEAVPLDFELPPKREVVVAATVTVPTDRPPPSDT